jgi:hypothetical protein
VISRRLLVLIAVAAALPSGCSFGSASSTHGSASSTHGTSRTQPQSATQPDVLELVRLTTYRGHGITFAYPASWRHRHRGFYSTMTSPIVDLGTQPMVDPCVHSGNSTSCWFPVRHLDRGGVVVMWSTGGGLIDPAHGPVPGVHVKTLLTGCRSLGGGEEITASVVLRGGRVYEAAACLRGPDVAAHEREVRAMLASAKRT